MWFDDAQQFSLSVGGFMLTQPTYTAYSNASTPGGSPVLARPVVDAVANANSSYLVSEPNVITGNIAIQSRSELFGIEANAGYSQAVHPNILGTLLFGYRGLHLGEGLVIQDQFAPLANSVLTYLGNTVNVPNSLSEQARFQTNNEFNGLNLGGKLRWTQQWFFAELIGKVALGYTDQHVKIDGATALYSPTAGLIGLIPGEVLTSPTNIGQQRRQIFGAVPEFGLNLGIDLINHVRLKAGYSFLAWTNVARAADQVDPLVNPGRIPTDPTYGTVGSSPHPVRPVQDHLLWVQAVNAGLEFHY
jgi:hypothetical protein